MMHAKNHITGHAADPVILVQQGDDLSSMGQRDAAAHCYRQALEIAPRMVAALVGLGRVQIADGDTKDALRTLRQAQTLNPGRPDILVSMGNCCVSLDMPEQARTLYREARDMQPAEPAVALPFVRILVEQGATDDARRVLLGIGDVTDPADHDEYRMFAAQLGVDAPTTIKPMWRDSFKKILVIAEQQNFVKNLAEHWSQTAEVRMCDGTDKSELLRQMQWCDLTWSDWCDQLLAEATVVSADCPIVARCHRYEVFSEYPMAIQWDRVRHIVFVADVIAQTFREFYQGKLPKAFRMPHTVVHNGVQFENYSLNEQKIYGKKVAYVGYLKAQKNPSLMLQCFKAIHRHDPGYTFHIAGFHQELVHENYWTDMVRRLDIPVVIDGWVDDVAGWLADKDYIISASISESFQYSIAESMALGLLPLVHTWKECETFYPGDALFRTADECVRILKIYEQTDQRQRARRNRRWLEERFTFERQAAGVDAVLNRVAEDVKTKNGM
jgi:glycosyltransferase involved in cell wall biosynthesis